MNSAARRFLAIALLGVCVIAFGSAPHANIWAQDVSPLPAAPADQAAEPEDEELTAPEQVDVDPVASDEDVADRLTRILLATEWFLDPEVRVEEGVVFLSASTTDEKYRTWAGDLARNTEGVVAVVNRIDVLEPAVWDLSPAGAELRGLARDTVQAMPLIGVAILLLLATWFVSKLAILAVGTVLERRMANRLLRQVITRAVAIPVFLLGLYLVLRISGLTQMAATVIGGTGLLGLIVGIAFRDIAENFLASILISMQRPFAPGDLIEIEAEHGYVQSVTTRGTVLMTLDGNHVQIPNSTVYKAVIRNFSANPTIRLNFVVGIGYDDSVAEAQEVALAVLHEHPIVLDDPEPLVLTEELSAATVNLKIYFWIDGSQHSVLKARSSVMRLVKRAFDTSGISMPDEAREVVFPKGVPLVTQNGDAADLPRPSAAAPQRQKSTNGREEQVTTMAEGDLASEAADIQQQAEKSRRLDDGTNLLDDEEAQPATAAP